MLKNVWIGFANSSEASLIRLVGVGKNAESDQMINQENQNYAHLDYSRL